MQTERTQRQINRFLEVAKEAAAQANWEMVLSNADRVLDMEPDNAQALDLRAAAKRALSGEQQRPAQLSSRKIGLNLLRRSLKLRMAVYFLVPSVLVVVALATTAFLVSRNILEDQAFEQLEVTSSFKELELNLFIDDIQENFNRIAALPAIRVAGAVLLDSEETNDRETAYENLEGLVESAAAAAPDLSEIFLLSGVGGRIFFSTDKSNEGGYRVTDSYYLRGLEGSVVQNVYPSPITSDPTLTLSTQLINGEGDRVGVIAAHVNLDKLDRIVKDRTGLGSSGESYLVDAFNVFVSAEGFGTEQYPRGVHSFGIDAAVNGERGAGTYSNYAGETVIGVFRWIPERDLALLTEVHRSEALAPARKLGLTLVLFGLIAVGLLGIGVYLIARRIADPVLAVSETAIKIASGDLNQTAPIRTEDEIGALAGNFNIMTGRLKNTLVDLNTERDRSESLLLNVLPETIADRLKDGEESIVDSFNEVSVLFADIAGFTEFAGQASPEKLLAMLNTVFTAFDELSGEHNLEKIKTIGDAYMVVSGLPVERPDHAEAIADLALDMQRVFDRLQSETNSKLRLRVGINMGPVVAGVVGTKKFLYDTWGDTVNTAARMESFGVPGEIQVTENTYLRLRNEYVFDDRGVIDVKGKGSMQVYLLKGKKPAGVYTPICGRFVNIIGAKEITHHWSKLCFVASYSWINAGHPEYGHRLWRRSAKRVPHRAYCSHHRKHPNCRRIYCQLR